MVLTFIAGREQRTGGGLHARPQAAYAVGAAAGRARQPPGAPGLLAVARGPGRSAPFGPLLARPERQRSELAGLRGRAL